MKNVTAWFNISSFFWLFSSPDKTMLLLIPSVFLKFLSDYLLNWCFINNICYVSMGQEEGLIIFCIRSSITNAGLNILIVIHKIWNRIIVLLFLQTKCAASWWGSPVCGPCNCSTELNFDSQCNKQTGACVCKVSAVSQSIVYYHRL